MVAGFKNRLSLLGNGGSSSSQTKSQTSSKSFELEVDLFGVEDDGITDLQDRPLQPGEKVDRYRFMTFYLEGNASHFHDFFGYVVDPEWLMGNDEEARALRQARAAKPNKCWRVLHRVTYVERPALEGFGRDVRAISPADTSQKITAYFSGLEAGQRHVDLRLEGMEAMLQQILSKLGSGSVP